MLDQNVPHLLLPEIGAYCASFEAISGTALSALVETGGGYRIARRGAQCAGCRYGRAAVCCLHDLAAQSQALHGMARGACPAGQLAAVTPLLCDGGPRLLLAVLAAPDEADAFAKACRHLELTLSCFIGAAGGGCAPRQNAAQLQLQALEKQLKPHFLFNTLSLIARLIILERYDDSLEAVYALSKMLRFIMDRKEYVRLREEVQYLKNYMFIQKARFQEKFSFQLDISQNILNAIVPSFCLQVLMENSIKHGLDAQDGGDIVVWGRLERDSVVLRVADNGVGFPDHMLADIFSPANHGSGLRNLAQRIACYYGEPYGVALGRSALGGAEVSLTLPFCLDEEERYLPSFWLD